jgi:hypothetical protein
MIYKSLHSPGAPVSSYLSTEGESHMSNSKNLIGLALLAAIAAVLALSQALDVPVLLATL